MNLHILHYINYDIMYVVVFCMLLSCALVSSCDIVVNRTGMPCLNLKNVVAYGLVFKEILRK